MAVRCWLRGLDGLEEKGCARGGFCWFETRGLPVTSSSSDGEPADPTPGLGGSAVTCITGGGLETEGGGGVRSLAVVVWLTEGRVRVRKKGRGAGGLVWQSVGV